MDQESGVTGLQRRVPTPSRQRVARQNWPAFIATGWMRVKFPSQPDRDACAVAPLAQCCEPWQVRFPAVASFPGTALKLAFLMLLALVATAKAQGPSATAPDGVLATWADATDAPQATELYTLAAKLYEEIEKEVAGYEEAIEAKNVKRLKPLPVGKSYAMNLHLTRIAERLSAWGEPAGYDLTYRSQSLERRLNAIRDAMSVPYAAAIQKALPAFKARAQKYKPVINEAEKLFAAEKPAEAEERLLPKYLELMAMAYWYEGKVVYGDLLPYGTIDGKLLHALTQANTKLADETIVKLRDNAAPDFTKLPAALEAAAAALKSAPTADFAGKSLTGPEIFLATVKQWRKLHEGYLHATALNMALDTKQDAGTKITQLTTDAKALHTQVATGLQSLIDADATRATADEAAELHARYVDYVAKLAWVSRNEDILGGFEQALERLADKSPTLQADRIAYRGATTDLLRWRNRAAETLAKAQRAKSSALSVASVLPIQVSPTLPEVIAKLAETLLKKDVYFAGAFLSVGKTPMTSGVGKSTLVRVKQPVLEVVTTLKDDLLVTDSLPPLTVAAARALRGAEHGAILECGGTITNVELIGAIPLLAADSPLRDSAISLGEPVPAELFSNPKPPLQVILVTEITPQWVRGDGYFSAVTP